MNEYIVQPYSAEDKIFTPLLCGITYPDINYRIKRAYPEYYVLEYVIDGKGVVITDEKKYFVEKGDVYLLKKERCEYYSDPEDAWTKIWLNFRGNVTEHLLSVYGLDDVTVIKNLNIYPQMKKILDICESQTNVNARTELVIHEIFRIMHDKMMSDGNSLSAEALLLRDYINTHTSENITIKKLASLIFRSEAQAIRIFKSAYNTTPYEYIISCRIKNAKMLLTSTNLYIKEIAYRTGFCDEHYFSNIFKERTGVTPKMYRTQYK